MLHRIFKNQRGGAKVYSISVDNTTGLEENIVEYWGDNIALSLNFPNPFSSTTDINFELFSEGNPKLTIHVASGRQVEELLANYFSKWGIRLKMGQRK